MFKGIFCNIALDNTKSLGNLWQYAWLVTAMKPLWNDVLKVPHDGPCPSKTNTF